ncbi:hypothetical protein E1287_09180 [Actinomadura sp. KC06]|uniref:hypothetical protein n=1 Tax=Actinomadura sp. KC06 TaxID=2530369 RepID=UPI00104F734C|nr:hypothetical protein [Actinomadura sp. KC06]TDD37101.1 hypothetical protein E1287_09180 [Actinomadura sp. KC06]
MADGAGRPLDELAEQLSQRRCLAQVYGDTLVVSLGVRGEQVIACDGQRFRWGGERGHVIGDVGKESAAADRTLLVLRQIRRWS